MEWKRSMSGCGNSKTTARDWAAAAERAKSTERMQVKPFRQVRSVLATPILLLIVTLPALAQQPLSTSDCNQLIKPLQLYVGKVVEFQKFLAEPVAPEPGFARPPVTDAGRAVEDTRAALIEPFNKYAKAYQDLLDQIKRCARK
jgi:hypothetical protein